MAVSFRETAFLLVDMSNMFEYLGLEKIKNKKNPESQNMRRNIYILEQQNIKTHKFLRKQRFKLSAALLKICQGDLTL